MKIYETLKRLKGIENQIDREFYSMNEHLNEVKALRMQYMIIMSELEVEIKIFKKDHENSKGGDKE